jgi:hypothetical protein
MVKDIKQEEEEKKEKVQESEKKEFFFSRVPILYKILGFGLIFIQYIRISQAGESLSKLFPWVIGVVIIWYLIGQTSLKINTGILTPEEAIASMEKYMMYAKKNQMIPQFAKYFVGPEIALFHHDGMPQHYQIAVEVINNDKREYMRGVVYAEGPTKSYATLQANSAKLTGREAIPIVSPIPRWMRKNKELSDFGFGMDKMMGFDRK